MNPLRQLFKFSLATCLPADRFLLRGPHGVALTFDDGPDPDITPELLDALARHSIPATFFVIGEKAERHPELITRMIDAGHAIGNHTWTHSEPKHTPAPQFKYEVQRTRNFLRDRFGLVTNLMRPPKGDVSLPKLRALLNERQTISLWSADPKDWAAFDAAEVTEWIDDHEPTTGEIVLMHDNHRHCIEAVAAAARWPSAYGRPFVTLADWFPSQHRFDTSESNSSPLRELSHV